MLSIRPTPRFSKHNGTHPPTRLYILLKCVVEETPPLPFLSFFLCCIKVCMGDGNKGMGQKGSHYQQLPCSGYKTLGKHTREGQPRTKRPLYVFKKLNSTSHPQVWAGSSTWWPHSPHPLPNPSSLSGITKRALANASIHPPLLIGVHNPSIKFIRPSVSLIGTTSHWRPLFIHPFIHPSIRKFDSRPEWQGRERERERESTSRRLANP